MDLMDIVKEWRADSTIDPFDLGGEALKIPKLHCKYYEFFIKQKYLLEKQKIQLKELEHLMTSYYQGQLSKVDLEEHKLQPLDIKILRQEIPRYLDADSRIIKQKQGLAAQSEKVDFIKSILDQIKGRSFVIRDAIEWEKFKQGG